MAEGLTCYKKNEKFFKRFNIGEKEYNPPTFKYLSFEKVITIKMLSDKKIMSHLRYVYCDQSNDKLYIFRISLVEILGDIYQNNLFKNIIISKEGEIIAHSAPEMIRDDHENFYLKIAEQLSKVNINVAVKEYSSAKLSNFSRTDNLASVAVGGSFINYFFGSFMLTMNVLVEKILKQNSTKGFISYARLTDINAIVVSEISKVDAYLAAIILFVKTLFFASFATSFLAILTLIFSRRITSRIKDLIKSTKFISNGNYDKLCIVSGNDETKLLADSFNVMVKEIQKNMVALEEKQRMKHEIEVASQVQQAFFPSIGINDNCFFGVNGYYKPASECSGDWYNILEFGDKCLIFIGDATGHGVPAALATASVNACVGIIKFLFENGGNYQVNTILSLLNQSICSMNSDINMTFFVASINIRNGDIV